MAPRKRKADGDETAAATAAAKKGGNLRVTRSAAKANKTKLTELPAKKKGKAVEKKDKKAKVEKKVTVEVKTETGGAEVGGEGEQADDGKAAAEEGDKDETDGGAGAKKTIVVEHCKQCNSFKTRANQVKDGLENAVPGVTVLLNPVKPRKGCFEVREEDGETFISLENMKRPFAPMKALDMDKVISDIVDKIKQ